MDHDYAEKEKAKRAEVLGVFDDTIFDEDSEESKKKISYDKRGRPSNMTLQAMAKLRQAFSIGCTDDEACLFANISRDTYYRYCQKDEDFRNECAELKEKPVLAARANIVNAINNGKSVEDSWKYLERKRKTEFSTRSEVTGADGESLSSGLTDEQKTALLALVTPEEPKEETNNEPPST